MAMQRHDRQDEDLLFIDCEEDLRTGNVSP